MPPHLGIEPEQRAPIISCHLPVPPRAARCRHRLCRSVHCCIILQHDAVATLSITHIRLQGAGSCMLRRTRSRPSCPRSRLTCLRRLSTAGRKEQQRNSGSPELLHVITGEAMHSDVGQSRPGSRQGSTYMHPRGLRVPPAPAPAEPRFAPAAPAAAPRPPQPVPPPGFAPPAAAPAPPAAAAAPRLTWRPTQPTRQQVSGAVRVGACSGGCRR